MIRSGSEFYENVEEDVTEELQKGNNCRGDEFEDRGKDTTVVEEKIGGISTGHSANRVAKLKQNDKIQYRIEVAGHWVDAEIIGRAGKATGQNNN